MKLRMIILVSGLFYFSHLLGQQEFLINDFSDKYFGKLTIDKGSEGQVFQKGTFAIFHKSTQKELLKIESDEFAWGFDDFGSPVSKPIVIAYEDQDLFVYQDFDFDGNQDLAIMDGQFSCYHGPSYQVYLETGNQLKHSPEFTRLAHDYCGMFRVDEENKTIHTTTKSGCCWHQYSEFKVIEGIPKEVYRNEEDATNFPFYSSKVIKWNGEKKIESIKTTVDLEGEGITKILSFNLLKSGKQAVIFSLNNRILNYALITPENLVEFNYPIEVIYKNPDFTINESEDKLTFANKGAKYQIYENKLNGVIKEIGIKVTVNGKVYDLKGAANSVKGTLKNVNEASLDNVIRE